MGYTSSILVLLSTTASRALAEVTLIGDKGITFEEMAHTAKDKHRHGHLPPPLASTKYNTVHTDFDHDTSWQHDKGSTTRDGDEGEKAEEEKPASASAFGTELFLTVSKNFPEGNILISPLSVYKALAMVSLDKMHELVTLLFVRYRSSDCVTMYPLDDIIGEGRRNDRQ